MTGQKNPQSTQFNNAASSPGSSYPSSVPTAFATFPSAPQSRAPSVSGMSQSAVTVDKSATKTETSTATDVKGEKVKNEPKKTGKSAFSAEALEKMMEDPAVQKIVYPNNMSGGSQWDSRMMDTLKNFDLNNPEVKQQFEEIGLAPEEVISKIMANPEVAMAFQNPRVQAAILECSQNPLNMAKYQHDKEVRDVFNKMSEIFPGPTG